MHWKEYKKCIGKNIKNVEQDIEAEDLRFDCEEAPRRKARF
jgi:hypothetical protein